MAMTEERVSELAGTNKKCNCDGRMVQSALCTGLSVRHPGETRAAYWSSSPLEAFTCIVCGRTELFAQNPGLLA